MMAATIALFRITRNRNNNLNLEADSGGALLL